MQIQKQKIPEFQKEDFIEGVAPYEWLTQYDNAPLLYQQFALQLKDIAASFGIKNFMTLLKAYKQSINNSNRQYDMNYTEFDGQELQLLTGEWICDDYGVNIGSMLGEIQACNHPIMPIQRLVNIDSGVEKLKIAYKKGNLWRSIIVDKQTLASSNKILQLADYGVAVNSENAKYLVKYLTDIEHLNYNTIPELHSVSRLGWVEDYGFSPYVDNIVFDGDVSFKHFFESVKEKGDFEKWKKFCIEARKHGVAAKILLASSFASVLVDVCDKLPFFLHLFGGSGAGKTVGLMLAASVWANPAIGKYIHNFNSTQVAQELSAGFVNSMPLLLDELQIIKDRKSFDDIIYQLSQGEGRLRGQKTGGLQKTMTWKNCILTTGENPIASEISGAGAMNRVIEIDCKDMKIFKDPVGTVEFLKDNYGFAGRLFVEWLQDDKNKDKIKTMQKQYQDILSYCDTTDKQASSASLILTADTIITELFFNDEDVLTVEELSEFLLSKKAVSINDRAYDYLKDFISINLSKFTPQEFTAETWGRTFDGGVYIIKSKFDEIMATKGYNSAGFLSWARSNGIIQTDSSGKNTILQRINGRPTRCVSVKMDD